MNDIDSATVPMGYGMDHVVWVVGLDFSLKFAGEITFTFMQFYSTI